MENGFSGFSKWVSDSKSSLNWSLTSRQPFIHESVWLITIGHPIYTLRRNICIIFQSGLESQSPKGPDGPWDSGLSSSERQFPNSRWNRSLKFKTEMLSYHLVTQKCSKKCPTLRPRELNWQSGTMTDHVKSFI